MSASSPIQKRNRVAALSRSRADDDPEFIDAKRDLAVAKIEAAITRIVDDAPPLTDAQVAHLTVALIRGGQR